jgi:hypothetical protein
MPLLIWLVVVATLTGELSWARPFGPELTGEEILVEAEQMGPGEEPPGIYAYAADGSLSLVVPLGRCPRWSPDHTKFAFMRGGETWVADLVAEETRRIDAVGNWSPHAVGAQPGWYLPAFTWTPDGELLAGWEDVLSPSVVEPVATTFRPVGRPVRHPDGPPHVLVTDVGPMSVGRLDFEPAGARVAYEAYRIVPDIGAVGRVVRIFDPQDRSTLALSPPIDGGASPCNPLWEPRSGRLCLEALQPAGGRSILVGSAAFETWQQVPAFSEQTDWMQAVEWLPAGERLLCLGAQHAGYADRTTYVVDIPLESERGPSVAKLSQGPWHYVYAACVSPDGQWVVQLVGGEPRLADAPQVTAVVVPADGSSDGVRFLDRPGPHLRCVGVDW